MPRVTPPIYSPTLIISQSFRPRGLSNRAVAVNGGRESRHADYGLVFAVFCELGQAFAERDGRRKTRCQETSRQRGGTAGERMDREDTREAVRAMGITSSAHGDERLTSQSKSDVCPSAYSRQQHLIRGTNPLRETSE